VAIRIRFPLDQVVGLEKLVHQDIGVRDVVSAFANLTGEVEFSAEFVVFAKWRRNLGHRNDSSDKAVPI
jgi:hypothetical protein